MDRVPELNVEEILEGLSAGPIAAYKLYSHRVKGNPEAMRNKVFTTINAITNWVNRRLVEIACPEFWPKR